MLIKIKSRFFGWPLAFETLRPFVVPKFGVTLKEQSLFKRKTTESAELRQETLKGVDSKLSARILLAKRFLLRFHISFPKYQFY